MHWNSIPGSYPVLVNLIFVGITYKSPMCYEMKYLKKFKVLTKIFAQALLLLYSIYSHLTMEEVTTGFLQEDCYVLHRLCVSSSNSKPLSNSTKLETHSLPSKKLPPRILLVQVCSNVCTTTAIFKCSLERDKQKKKKKLITTCFPYLYPS